MSSFTAKNMAVFIDADNLSNATALDHVFADLQSRAERISYRRAYGRPESLKNIESVLWRHGVRPVTNLVTNKVTTDIALTIDVVETVCRRDFDAVVICSGDADFVPLAIWLREQCCFVLCFSLNSILFANPESFYDEVVRLEVVEKPEPVAEPPIAPAPKPVLSVSSLPPVPSPASQNVDMVQQVLQAFPALRSGEPQHLGLVVAALRQCGILEVGAKTTTWFAQWSVAFELLPAQAPNRIFYKKPCAVTPQKTAKQLAPKKPVLPQQPPVATKLPALPEDVTRVLKAVPALRDEPQQLSQLVPVLRQKTILGKTSKSTTFFARYAAYFKLTPSTKPTHVAYSAPPSITVADVLLAVPEVMAGQLMDLGSVSKKLCDKGVVVSPAHAQAVLMTYPSSFRLLPPGMPNAVQYLG